MVSPWQKELDTSGIEPDPSRMLSERDNQLHHVPILLDNILLISTFFSQSLYPLLERIWPLAVTRVSEMTSSWFPFPFNISLSALVPPLSIQRRFISFILKRSLGHLLKPGQFDLQQIDAQIGNGFVEVKDLQLDADVSFQLS